MRERANNFKRVIQTNPEQGLRSGTYIYSSRTIKKYIDNPGELVSKLALLGFTDVYISFDKPGSSLSLLERFDGISADLEPHILKIDSPRRPEGLTLAWDSESNYGIGKYNDLLLKRTVEVMSLAKKAMGLSPLFNHKAGII
ncbi:MAG: hypothetical protein WCX48_08215 [Bacteroidales bacterium]